MIEILLVEDDPILGRGLNVSLELEGYKVHWAQDLKTARLLRVKKRPALVLLDLGLPDGSGLDFLTELRSEGSSLPIIILTAKGDESSVVQGLQSGANDYVRKPFGQRELLARIKTTLREPQNRENHIRYGDLLVLPDQRRVLHHDKPVELNRREFDILAHLIKHAGTVVSRDALISLLDRDSEIFDRTIDSHISHVRARLRQAGATSVQISAVYGVGYRLERK